MFSKLLLCTDLTPASESLIACAAALKEVGTREVILTHVIHVANTAGLEETLIAAAEPVLERQRMFLEGEGLKVTVQTPVGTEIRTLHDTAEHHDVSVILVGSQGKGVVKSATVGSVSLGLLHLTRRPLLLDRVAGPPEGGCPDGGCRRMFDRILFPTDFSQTAERALGYVGKIAREANSVVTLLHAMPQREDDPENADRREEEARYLLDAKKLRLERLGAADVMMEVAFGKAAEEIVSRTRTGAFTCVVIGGHGKGILKELIVGSTANEVARHAEVPVLFIPADQ